MKSKSVVSAFTDKAEVKISIEVSSVVKEGINIMKREEIQQAKYELEDAIHQLLTYGTDHFRPWARHIEIR